jgi:hypothetical protein
MSGVFAAVYSYVAYVAAATAATRKRCQEARTALAAQRQNSRDGTPVGGFPTTEYSLLPLSKP